MKNIIDKIDKKIISILLQNSRTPISKIAKRCLISKQACHYRIKRLEQEDIIQGYKAKIDISKLGYNTYCIYLKTSSMQQEEEQIIIDKIKQKLNTRWIVTCTGKWDLMIAISCKDNYEFNKLLKDMLKIFSKKIINYETAIIISTQDIWMKEKSTIQKPLNEIKISEEYKLDNNDHKILQLLANNARITTTKIAEKTTLTPEAIAHRIKKLHKEGIIQAYSVSINIEKLGATWYQIQFQLQDITEQEEKQLISKLIMIEGISYIVRMIGRWNFEVNMYCKNIAEFKNNLNNIKEALKQYIRDYTTNIIFQKHKSTTYAIEKI